jgi:hypothetical protein
MGCKTAENVRKALWHRKRLPARISVIYGSGRKFTGIRPELTTTQHNSISLLTMTTFYGPICPTFRGGPNHVIAYNTILAPAFVHGPSVPVVQICDDFPIINHFMLPSDVAAIAPPLINPNDTDTWEGWFIHYNRVRMIAASTLFHNGADGSFPHLAR